MIRMKEFKEYDMASAAFILSSYSDGKIYTFKDYELTPGILNYLFKYRIKSGTKVYRGTRTQDQSTNTDVESWSLNKEFASMYGDIKEKIVKGNELFIDVAKFFRDSKNRYSGEVVSLDEILIAQEALFIKS